MVIVPSDAGRQVLLVRTSEAVFVLSEMWLAITGRYFVGDYGGKGKRANEKGLRYS
jgi:hypothetical protein